MDARVNPNLQQLWSPLACDISLVYNSKVPSADSDKGTAIFLQLICICKLNIHLNVHIHNQQHCHFWPQDVGWVLPFKWKQCVFSQCNSRRQQTIAPFHKRPTQEYWSEAHTLIHTPLVTCLPNAAQTNGSKVKQITLFVVSFQIVVLVLGCSFVLVSVVVTPGTFHLWITPSLILGSLVGWQKKTPLNKDKLIGAICNNLYF